MSEEKSALRCKSTKRSRLDRSHALLLRKAQKKIANWTECHCEGA